MFGSLYSNFNYKNLKLNSKKSVIERQVRDRERTLQNEKHKIDSFHDNSTPSFHIDMPDTAYNYSYNIAEFGELLTMSDASFNHLLSQEENKNLFAFGNSIPSVTNIQLLEQLNHLKQDENDAYLSSFSESEINEIRLQEKYKNLFTFDNNISSVNIPFLKELDNFKTKTEDAELTQSEIDEIRMQEKYKNLFTFDNQMTIQPNVLQQLKQFSDFPDDVVISDSKMNELVLEQKNKNLFDIQHMSNGVSYNMKTFEELANDENTNAHAYAYANANVNDSEDINADDTMSKIAAKNLLGVGFHFDAGAAAASIVHNSMYDKLLQIHKKETEIPAGLAQAMVGCSVTIQDVYKKNIRCICNVYQPKYKDNINVTGFGDFIRGCYFLLQFCEQHNLQFKTIINHPIAYFLQHHQPKSGMMQSNTNIKFFVNNNWTGYFLDEQNCIHSIPGKTEDIQCAFMSYLVNDIGVHGSGSAFVYSISYPCQDNSNSISENHKQTLRRLLEPSDLMKNVVSSELASLGLFPHKYAVIHIRSGDTQFNLKNTNPNTNPNPSRPNDNLIHSSPYLEKLFNEIRNLLMKCGGHNILLNSDSNELKQILKKKYPGLKILLRSITHLGEGVALDRVKIQNTLSDFYLLSFSNAVYSFSCYEHGTGFSQWCATTYNIPYFCKYVV